MLWPLRSSNLQNICLEEKGVLAREDDGLDPTLSSQTSPLTSCRDVQEITKEQNQV